ncbi:MAG: Fic family protein [Acidobacteriota bacterium]|nr:Fic family protein [Blastocatellia bacterium]MDW8411669.1 Fic family protein [Acidobacteriota bacterium]
MPKLPIYNESRPSYGWVSELASRQAALKTLEPLPLNEIARYYLNQQVLSLLKLSGWEDIEAIDYLIGADPALDDLPQHLRPVNALTNACSYVYKKADSPDFRLTQELLLEIHTLLAEGSSSDGGVYRTGVGRSVATGHEPVESALLVKLVENALSWFATPAFGELHPVEQAWLVHLRLVDLQPFESLNDWLALLVAGAYTIRAGLPPVIVKDAVGYGQALSASFQMFTQPGVELFARSLIRSLDEVIAIFVGGNR